MSSNIVIAYISGNDCIIETEDGNGGYVSVNSDEVVAGFTACTVTIRNTNNGCCHVYGGRGEYIKAFASFPDEKKKVTSYDAGPSIFDGLGHALGDLYAPHDGENEEEKKARRIVQIVVIFLIGIVVVGGGCLMRYFQI